MRRFDFTTLNVGTKPLKLNSAAKSILALPCSSTYRHRGLLVLAATGGTPADLELLEAQRSMIEFGYRRMPWRPCRKIFRPPPSSCANARIIPGVG